MTEQKRDTDSGTAEDTVDSILAFQSGALVIHARKLAEMASNTADKDEEACLATAAILMAASAIEALLSEAAYLKNSALYERRSFRCSGVPAKFRMLMGYTFRNVSPDGDELWSRRNALTHAEPDHIRTRFVGTRINAEGAHWAAEIAGKLAVIIWGNEMPRWFSETTGLRPATG